MSMPSGKQQAALISSRTQLLEYLVSGNKPPSEWRIGTEHEKFGFRNDDLRPPTFEGERGIGALLEGMAARFGWTRVRENGQLIALKKDLASVTLEPAGQLELSGAPLRDIHATCCETMTHLQEVKSVASEMELGFLGMGFQPKWARSDMPWMPKGRYQIMRDYMPKVGNLGLDMMTRTCTVQVNLDYENEADMVKKFRVSLALQPIATALFADSPFTEGKPNGFMSFRSNVWTDTDPDRTGLLDFVFDQGFSFERYVDYILDVPMYFVYRDGRYLDASGQSFRDFLAGKLPVYPGQLPTFDDFTDHLTTAFPEVRLKKFLEMRGADGGPWNRLCALPAFWVGLLYDQTALDAAWDLVKDWSLQEREQLRTDAPRSAMRAPFRNIGLLEIARQALAISANGLARRAIKNSQQADERIYLDPLLEFAEAGICPADRKLELFHGAWRGSVDPVFTEFSY